MSSETDHPRQRTVAELLAAHGAGDGNTSGRRRRRREPDDLDEGAHGAPAGEPPEWQAAPPREPERPAMGDGLPPDQREPDARRRAGAGPQRDPLQQDQGQWDAGRRATGQHDTGQHDTGQRDTGQWDAGQWDPGPRDASGWDAEPAQPWDAPSRETRYPDAAPREAAPRRAQRREPDDWESAPEPPAWDAGEPSRSWDPLGADPLPSREREAAPWQSRGAEQERNGHSAGRTREPRSWDAAPPEAPPVRAAGPVRDRAPAAPPLPAAPMPESPTEQMPRIRDEAPDAGLTRPMQQQRRRSEAAPPEQAPDDDGPATMVGGAPAGAEAWHRARTDGRGVAGDGGPPTQAAPPIAFDDDDDVAEDDYPAGLGHQGVDDEATGFFAPEDAEPETAGKRRSAPAAAGEQAGGGPAWAAVIAQWIAGAIGGAALWVGFRFLWRDLEVVALAAAVLITVGLVLVVRALLRSNDLRTTLFAVLVGLLLTVSPAILVLLGK